MRQVRFFFAKPKTAYTPLFAEEGKGIEPHDLFLLEHENLELRLVQRGSPQDEAHIIASRKFNYTKALGEFNDSH
jgi:hypothetical protein